MEDLKKLTSILKTASSFIEEVIPDGKLHESGDDYYVTFQRFNSKSNAVYYTMFYGDRFDDEPSMYCTLENISMDEQFVVKGLAKLAKRIINGKETQTEKKEAPKGMAVYPLGHKNGSYFFTSSANKQIIEVVSFTEQAFSNIAPLEFWEAYSPGKEGVAWSRAKFKIMQECRDRGLFESKKVRGAGVWGDAGRIVVNMGDHLIVDGEVMQLEEIKSEFFYTLGTKLSPLSEKPLTLKECGVIRKAASTFKWNQPDFAYLIAGAMVTTRVCGALPIRPHTWVTGGSNTGKSTLFTKFIYPLIGQPMLFLAGGSTEAGIRQAVLANAIPILFDEFENGGSKSAAINQSVVDTMRVSWSETNAVILKGSAGGVAQSFQVRSACIVASVRQISLSDADRSRFATIELAPHGNDPEHWTYLESLLDQITEDYGNRLFARTIKMLPILLENFKMMKKALNKRSPGQRFADQYGMLLAGYSILLQDESLDEDSADTLARIVPLEEARESSKVTDHDSCLNSLLTKKIKIDDKDCSMGEAILSASQNSLVRGSLQSYGIRAEKDWFAVQAQHKELENIIFRDSQWSNSWSKSLVRLTGAKRKNMRVAGIVKECIVIPMTHLTDGKEDSVS